MVNNWFDFLFIFVGKLTFKADATRDVSTSHLINWSGKKFAMHFCIFVSGSFFLVPFFADFVQKDFNLCFSLG